MKNALAILRTGLAAAGVFVGAGLVLAGALGPWAQATVFRNISVSIPGLFFAGGGLCLAVALLILLGGRRSPLLCLVGAVCVLGWAVQAQREVPRLVKHQVIGAQMALFPLNRLLDQFHINDVEVFDGALPDDQWLGPGLTWTRNGGLLLLLGSALGLPGDPAIVWVTARTARTQCARCGARWLRARRAIFCPECGEPAAHLSRGVCSVCGQEAQRGDRHCVRCGQPLPDCKNC